jgi:hypothetical protein
MHHGLDKILNRINIFREDGVKKIAKEGFLRIQGFIQRFGRLN